MSKLIPRAYQLAIANAVLSKGSTLVVLPTGLGKTLIAMIVMDRFIKAGNRCLFLSPTRALVAQHYRTLSEHFSDIRDDIVEVNGSIQRKKRLELWKKKIVVSTPQTVANDIEYMDFSFSFVVFDEAHRAVGKYAYTKIAEKCKEKNATVLGLTASPGSKQERIKEIVEALGITHIEARDYTDDDVARYVMKKTIKWIKVDLDSEYLMAINLLREIGNEYVEELKAMGIMGNYRSKKGLSELRQKILKIEAGYRYRALSLYTALFNIVHMQELLETQGVAALREYVEKLRTESKSKSVARLLRDQRIHKVLELVRGKENPKLGKLVELLNDMKHKKVMVFAQYRAQVEKIAEVLNANGIPSQIFMGKGKGFSAKNQKEVIENFNKSVFQVLVSTSIGEEGIDIPSVDCVIFYEPIPSEIRSIQRKGRAGRAKIGEVIILVAKGTRDEVFLWSAQKREKRMRRLISQINDELSEKNIVTYDDAASSKVDFSEPVVKEEKKSNEAHGKRKQTLLKEFFS